MSREIKIAEKLTNEQFEKLKGVIGKPVAFRINDVLHLAFGADGVAKVEQQAKKALARGATITWPDGRTEWIENREVLKPGTEGSARYTWSGDRVLCERVLCTKQGGSITKKIIGKVYIDFGNLHE
jgi:hypothetical protein